MFTTVTIKNLLGKNLVGNFFDAKSEKVIVLCHGFMSEKTRSGKYTELAEKLVKNDFSVYSFDLSGYGESDDELVTISSGVLDLRCILSYVRFNGFKKIGVVGHSLGGIISLNQSLEKINSLCLLAPVTDKISYSLEDRFGKDAIDKMHEDGFMRLTEGVKLRKYFDVSEKFNVERKTVDQKELLSDVNLPTLIIHGSEDKLVPVEDSKRAIKYLSKESRLEIIEGENHGLSLNLEKVNNIIIEWFNNTIK